MDDVRNFIENLRKKEEENKNNILNKKKEKYVSNTGSSVDLIHIYEETYRKVYEIDLNKEEYDVRILQRNMKSFIKQYNFSFCRSFIMMCIYDWNAIRAKKKKECLMKLSDKPLLKSIFLLRNEEDLKLACENNTGVTFGVHRMSNWLNKIESKKTNRKLEDYECEL